MDIKIEELSEDAINALFDIAKLYQKHASKHGDLNAPILDANLSLIEQMLHPETGELNQQNLLAFIKEIPSDITEEEQKDLENDLLKIKLFTDPKYALIRLCDEHLPSEENDLIKTELSQISLGDYTEHEALEGLALGLDMTLQMSFAKMRREAQENHQTLKLVDNDAEIDGRMKILEKIIADHEMLRRIERELHLNTNIKPLVERPPVTEKPSLTLAFSDGVKIPEPPKGLSHLPYGDPSVDERREIIHLLSAIWIVHNTKDHALDKELKKIRIKEYRDIKPNFMNTQFGVFNIKHCLDLFLDIHSKRRQLAMDEMQAPERDYEDLKQSPIVNFNAARDAKAQTTKEAKRKITMKLFHTEKHLHLIENALIEISNDNPEHWDRSLVNIISNIAHEYKNYQNAGVIKESAFDPESWNFSNSSGIENELKALTAPQNDEMRKTLHQELSEKAGINIANAYYSKIEDLSVSCAQPHGVRSDKIVQETMKQISNIEKDYLKLCYCARSLGLDVEIMPLELPPAAIMGPILDYMKVSSQNMIPLDDFTITPDSI